MLELQMCTVPTSHPQPLSKTGSQIPQADFELLIILSYLLSAGITGTTTPRLTNAGLQTQDFVHARYALHQLSYIPSPLLSF